MKKEILVIVALTAFLLVGCGTEGTKTAQDSGEPIGEYNQRIEKWRKGYETELRAERGWLTLAGLEWLKEGENSIGVGEKFDIQLPDRLEKGKFGAIDFDKGKINLSVANEIDASIGGKKISEKTELASDEKGKPTVVVFGDLEMHAIKRNDKYAIRIRDKKSRQRVEFKGLNWFPVDKKYEVVADFEAFGEDRDFLVPNVLDQTVTMKSPGILRFVIDEKEHKIQPALNGDGRLFLIFRDLSSKTTTYGGGRFMYTKMPENGKVTLDFNKAENPPCAYTEFATCPLPPSQNEMDVELNVGEKRFNEY